MNKQNRFQINVIIVSESKKEVMCMYPTNQASRFINHQQNLGRKNRRNKIRTAYGQKIPWQLLLTSILWIKRLLNMEER